MAPHTPHARQRPGAPGALLVLRYSDTLLGQAKKSATANQTSGKASGETTASPSRRVTSV